jgi:hypothetical protein
MVECLREVIIFFGALNRKILRQLKDKINFKMYNIFIYSCLFS